MDYSGVIDSYPMLYHHGIKGMKWGVRRYQNADGTWKKKARIGSAERVRQKQAFYQDRLNRNASKDSNALYRNTINDYRRGRIDELSVKANHREARNAYRKNRTASNKASLSRSRNERIRKNIVAPTIGKLSNIPGSGLTAARGADARYAKAGKNIGQRSLRMIGGLTVAGVAGVGMYMASQQAGKKLVEEYFKRAF